jgi:hypothetical protein
LVCVCACAWLAAEDRLVRGSAARAAMGACQSGPSAAELEAQRLAEDIDKKNREEWERQQQKIKLLLLGACGVFTQAPLLKLPRTHLFGATHW